MELIKENVLKKRKVFKDNNRYIKIWDNVSSEWVINHVDILQKLCPNYVISYGTNFVILNEIPGIPASKFEHTKEFIQRIYTFCLENIEQTTPYVHMDWVLSNIIVQPDNTFKMIDWDNVGIYSKDIYMKKLNSDLYSAFGDKFNDAAGI